MSDVLLSYLVTVVCVLCVCCVLFFQAEDGIRYLVRSRGLGDVYKRQVVPGFGGGPARSGDALVKRLRSALGRGERAVGDRCLLYTSDAADERSSVDLGGRRIIKKKKQEML